MKKEQDHDEFEIVLSANEGSSPVKEVVPLKPKKHVAFSESPIQKVFNIKTNKIE